jgi:hypothetical protein
VAGRGGQKTEIGIGWLRRVNEPACRHGRLTSAAAEANRGMAGKGECGAAAIATVEEDRRGLSGGVTRYSKK